MATKKRYGSRKTRRLPDTYNFEVVRGGKSGRIVNTEQFEFLKGAEPEPRGEKKRKR